MRWQAIALALVGSALALGAPAGAAAFEQLSSFASYGQGAGQLGGSGGIAVTSAGVSYVADTANNRIAVFAADGSFVRGFGKEVNPSGGNICTTATGCRQGVADASAGALSAPGDVAVAADGTVYVADTANNRIAVFAADGSFTKAFGTGVNPSGGDICTAATGCQKGVKSAAAGALPSPAGIGIDSAGTLYAVTDNYRVDVFASDGSFIRAFGDRVDPPNGDVCTAASSCEKGKKGPEAGMLEDPYDVAVDAKGQIAVSDAGNQRINVFNPKGEFIRGFGKSVTQGGDGSVCTVETKCRRGKGGGDAGALEFPSGIALSGAGDLYVADAETHRISEFGFDGSFVRAFGVGVLNGAFTLQACTKATGCKVGIAGTISGAVSNPRGTAVDCRGSIYAVEVATGSNGAPNFSRVERFGEPGSAPAPCLPSVPEPEPPSVPPPPEPLPSASIRLPSRPPSVMKPKVKFELDQASGTAVLSVIVSDPGALLLRGKGIRTVKQQVKQAGLFELFVEGTGRTKAKLQETLKAKVKLLLTYEPDKGSAITQKAALVLKLAPRP